MEVKKSSTEEPRPELSQKNNNQADWGEGFVLGRQEQHEQRYRGRGHCWLELKCLQLAARYAVRKEER